MIRVDFSWWSRGQYRDILYDVAYNGPSDLTRGRKGYLQLPNTVSKLNPGHKVVIRCLRSDIIVEGVLGKCFVHLQRLERQFWRAEILKHSWWPDTKKKGAFYPEEKFPCISLESIAEAEIDLTGEIS